MIERELDLGSTMALGPHWLLHEREILLGTDKKRSRAENEVN
jgi:hypothetical protein